MSILPSPRHRGCHSIRAPFVVPFLMGRPPQRRQADTLVEQWGSEFQQRTSQDDSLDCRVYLWEAETPDDPGSGRPAMRLIREEFARKRRLRFAARPKDRAGRAHDRSAGASTCTGGVSAEPPELFSILHHVRFSVADGLPKTTRVLRSHRAHAHSEQMRAASAHQVPSKKAVRPSHASGTLTYSDADSCRSPSTVLPRKRRSPARTKPTSD